MKDIIFELKKKLIESVRRNIVSGLLFSGGVDTSILAALNPSVRTITVNLESFGGDFKYSKQLARDLKLEHHHVIVKIDEAIDSIPAVIKILKNFDPAIPNDLAVYFGLKTAKEMGAAGIMTGDGADEIFAGYDFMKDMEELDRYIKRISSFMSFSSNELGDFFGIKIRQPYIDREFIDFALDIPVKFKIREENKKLWGKWILRKAFEDKLGKDIAWQSKRPLEYGSGMTKLREIISLRIPDKEFEKKKKAYHPVKFINKEHLYFYEIYKKVVGKIPKPADGEKACPSCGGGMKVSSFHCKICGGVLGWKN